MSTQVSNSVLEGLGLGVWSQVSVWKVLGLGLGLRGQVLGLGLSHKGSGLVNTPASFTGPKMLCNSRNILS